MKQHTYICKKQQHVHLLRCPSSQGVVNKAAAETEDHTPMAIVTAL